ncbi:MAG: amidophosphoribosyltransferase [Candidatus Cloacimonadia bacterium]
MCGIIGVNPSGGIQRYDAGQCAVLGLFAIQHRGQESCGVALSDGNKIILRKEMGLVKEVFPDNEAQKLDGKLAIGHVRYPTKGKSDIKNAQPHVLTTLHGPCFALASNGDIVNYKNLREELEKEGVFFESDNDGELILKYIGFWHITKNYSIIGAIKRVMANFQASYSSLLLTKDRIYAFRDPFGNRPLVIGKTDEGTFVFASETCSLDILDAHFIREVRPGEIVWVQDGQLQSHQENPDMYRLHHHNAQCVFEMIYFSRPDSIVFGHKVYDFRERIGSKLAENETIKPDIVIPVPDSSNFIGLGYAKKLGVEFDLGLIRNHYIGRTFIKPAQTFRDEGVRQKFNVLPEYLNDKIVTLVDDSIVRGTTLKKIVRLLKKNGAKEVHVRIGSPMIKYSCYYGIDTPTREELIASQKSIEDIRAFLDADSLRYLTLEELKNIVTQNEEFCYACFDGIYPIRLYNQV